MEIVDAVDIVELTIDGHSVTAPTGHDASCGPRAPPASTSPPSARTTGSSRSPPAGSAWSRSRARAPRSSPARRRSPTAWSSRTETDELAEQRACSSTCCSPTTATTASSATGPARAACRSSPTATASARPASGARSASTRSATTTPFIAYDPAKCILCGRCVGICEQVQQCHVLDFAERGFASLIATSFGRSMVETELRAVRQLRLGLPDRRAAGQAQPRAGRTWDADGRRHRLPVLRLRLQRRAARQRRARRQRHGRRSARARTTATCASRAATAIQFIGHPDRLTAAAGARDGELVPATWDEALDLVAERLRRRIKADTAPTRSPASPRRAAPTRRTTSSRSSCAPSSARNNVDHCARLCHASTVAGLRAVARQRRDDQLDRRPCDGRRDPRHRLQHDRGHPIGALHIKQALREGAKLDRRRPARDRHGAPRRHPPAAASRAPTSPLLNGLMHVILDEGLADEDFIAERTEGFEALREVLRAVHARAGRGDHRRAGRRRCARRRASTRGRRSAPPSSTPWASPSTRTAPRTCSPSPTWPCSPATSAGPAPA